MSGRPTKLTAETHAKIIKAIQLGASYELAASYGGVSYSAFNNWRKRGEDEMERREGNAKQGSKQWRDEEPFVQFVKDIKEAEGKGVVGWLAKIEKAASDGNWQAAAWKLERRYPEIYGRQRIEHTGKDGGRLPHETLDVGVLFWRLALSLTLWGIGGWSSMVIRVLGAKEYPHVE